MSEKQELLFKEKEFSIFREKDMNSAKDSSRMLKVGAKESLYMQCEDDTMSEAFNRVIKFIFEGSPVICESGSLARSIQPGLHLFLENGNGKNKQMELINRVVHFNGEEFDLDIDQIVFNGNTWKLL